MFGAKPIGAGVILLVEQFASDEAALRPPVIRARQHRRIARRRQHELRRFRDMVGMALAMDAPIEQRRIVTQGGGNASGDLGPGDVLGEIGLGAEQGERILAAQGGGAAGGGRLLAQHQPVGAIDMVGCGEGRPEVLEQALFLRRREIGLAPGLARQPFSLAAP